MQQVTRGLNGSAPSIYRLSACSAVVCWHRVGPHGAVCPPGVDAWIAWMHCVVALAGLTLDSSSAMAQDAAHLLPLPGWRNSWFELPWLVSQAKKRLDPGLRLSRELIGCQVLRLRRSQVAPRPTTTRAALPPSGHSRVARPIAPHGDSAPARSAQ